MRGVDEDVLRVDRDDQTSRSRSSHRASRGRPGRQPSGAGNGATRETCGWRSWPRPWSPTRRRWRRSRASRGPSSCGSITSKKYLPRFGSSIGRWGLPGPARGSITTRSRLNRSSVALPGVEVVEPHGAGSAGDGAVAGRERRRRKRARNLIWIAYPTPPDRKPCAPFAPRTLFAPSYGAQGRCAGFLAGVRSAVGAAAAAIPQVPSPLNSNERRT